MKLSKLSVYSYRLWYDHILHDGSPTLGWLWTYDPHNAYSFAIVSNPTRADFGDTLFEDTSLSGRLLNIPVKALLRAVIRDSNPYLAPAFFLALLDNKPTRAAMRTWLTNLKETS